MGTKNYSSYSDMITFSRASSGTALAKISYGAELVTVTTPDFLQNATASGLTVTSDGTIPCRSSFTLSNLTIGSIYLVTCEVTNTTSVFWDDAPTLAGSVQTIINESANNYIVASATTMYLGFKEFSPSLGQEFVFSNVSVRKILFDQPDGTLQLFNHPTNQPRVEYDYQGNRLGLLVEEARTNLITYSNDFTDASWIENGLTTSQVSVTAPNGSSESTKITEDGATGVHQFYGQNVSGISPVAVSGYFKAAEYSTFQLTIGGAVNQPYANFDLSSETVSATGNGGAGFIQDVGNGWYRCTLTATPASNGSWMVFLTDGDTVASRGPAYTGDGTSGIYIWGAQVEAGSFPTSYIPTAGSTVTRAADVATIGVGAFGYNKTAGTVLITADSAQTTDYPGAFAFNGNSGANRWYLYSSAGTWTARQFIDNVGTGIINLSAVEASAETKLALALKGSSASAVKDGGSVVNNATFPIPPLIDEMEIGDGPGGVTQLNGHISSIAYYPRRLTDAQIKALTSPPETPTLSLTFDDSSTSYLETSIHG